MYKAVGMANRSPDAAARTASESDLPSSRTVTLGRPRHDDSAILQAHRAVNAPSTA